MDLIPYIYHERQEPGSMLCAQHALNNLMQSPIWTVNNLADIARDLDSMEDLHLDSPTRAQRRGRSANYDDSGFFSVQVIDVALHQLGLRLVRWNSDEMKPRRAYPENQDAFILNHNLHWFTLRRFGGNADRWYNLNSVTDGPPTWIGSGFLSMTISQAEAEGYSIFTIAPVHPSEDPKAPQPGSLMSCDADDRAQSFNSLLYSPPAGSSSGSSATNRRRRAEEEEITEDQPRLQRPRVAHDQNLNGMNDLSEAEQLRLAIEASLLDDRPSRPGESSDSNNDDDHDDSELDDDQEPELFDHTNYHKPSLNPYLTSSLSHRKPDFESQIEAAIRASLGEDSVGGASTSTPAVSGSTDEENWDEPTAEELRQKRLARFA